jgi:sulfur-oxidizing protein SoxY
MTDPNRRTVLKGMGRASLVAAAMAAGLLRPSAARAARNTSAFEAKTVNEALKSLNIATPADSKDILIRAPDIAENGAVVPIGVTSNLPKTESIAILVEKNPHMLAAAFDIPQGTEPSLTTRVKMGQSSNVYALVKADGKYHVASKEIKVTLGGCGG